MVYIVFNPEKIYGIYDTLDLVKSNCYIFTYNLLKEGKISREAYFDVKDKLFDLKEVTLIEIQKIVLPVDIHTEYYTLEKNGSVAFKNILNHIDERLKQLEERLELDSRVTVRFPGNSAADNMMITSEVEDSWKNLDKKNYKIFVEELKDFITIRIQKLELKFGDRINFGNVSDKNASETSYQVWPADAGNWNLPMNSRIFGDGFAVCFEFQVPGVFGIVTDPMYGYKF